MVSSIIRGGSAVLWFIPMIIGLYLCQPILNKIVESKEATKYFLTLSLVFLATFCRAHYRLLTTLVVRYLVKYRTRPVRISIICRGYASYFVGGYCLRHGGFARGATASSDLYRNFTVNVPVMSVAVFIFLKYHELQFVKIMGMITRIAQYGFGIYLVHILFITILSWIGITTLSFSPILSVNYHNYRVYIIVGCCVYHFRDIYGEKISDMNLIDAWYN